MSQSIQSFASAGLISTPLGSSGENPSPDEFSAAVGSSKLAVDGNAVDTGRYLIIGSDASTHGGSSYANDGQITIYDKQTNTYLNVWGDPHLTASDGNVAEFQRNGIAINLADGTTVEIQPTALNNGVAHISEVAVTSSSGTVLMSNFEGQAGSQVDISAVRSGNAHSSDSSMGNLNDTVLVAGKQDIGALTTLGGSQISSTNPTFSLDGIGGGVEQYFTNFVTSAMIGVGGQSTGGVAGNSDQSAQPAAAASAPLSSATVALPVSETPATVPIVTQSPTAGLASASSPPDLGLLMQSLTAQVANSPTLTSDQKVQALVSLETMQAELNDAPAKATTAAAQPSSNPSAGISTFTIDNILRVSNGLAPIVTTPDTVSAASSAPAAISATVPGMVSQLVETINSSSLGADVKTALSAAAQSLGTLLTMPPAATPATGTVSAAGDVGAQAPTTSVAQAPAATPNESASAPAAQATAASNASAQASTTPVAQVPTGSLSENVQAYAAPATAAPAVPSPEASVTPPTNNISPAVPIAVQSTTASASPAVPIAEHTPLVYGGTISTPPPDLGQLVQGLASQIAASPALSSDQKFQALMSLETMQAQLLDAPAKVTAAAAQPSSDPSAGISTFTIDNILRKANGLAPIAAAPDPTALAPVPAAVSATVPGMIGQLLETINSSSLGANVKTALSAAGENLGSLLAAPAAPSTAGATTIGGGGGSALPLGSRMVPETSTATSNENTPAPAAQAAAAQATGVSA